MTTRPMPHDELSKKLRDAIALLDELSAEMNESSQPCKCCGFAIRANYDDHQAKQAFDGIGERLRKLHTKLQNGGWSGRDPVPTVQASEVR